MLLCTKYERQPDKGNVDDDVDNDEDDMEEDEEEEEDGEVIEGDANDEGQDGEGGAGHGEPAHGQQSQPTAARHRRLPTVRSEAEMVQTDGRTLRTLLGALQRQQLQQRQRERVKAPSYERKSDPDDSLSIMRHLAQTYGWKRAERLGKLKTALTG